MGVAIIYYGDLTAPASLRKVAVREGQAHIVSRTGLANPTKGRRNGALIPDGEEDALITGTRAIGGRTSQSGSYIRLAETGEHDPAILASVLALAESLWGAPTGTAADYDITPTPVADLSVDDALRAAGIDRPDAEPQADTAPTAGHGGPRAGAGRPEVGRPVPIRLGEDLTARIDAQRTEGETRAAAIRRLLTERLGGPDLTRNSARRAMLAIGAGLSGDDPVQGADAHYQALAVLLDDVDINLALRPSVVGVAYTVEQAVEELVIMLTADEDERDLMERIIWEDMAERASKRLESFAQIEARKNQTR